MRYIVGEWGDEFCVMDTVDAEVMCICRNRVKANRIARLLNEERT